MGPTGADACVTSLEAADSGPAEASATRDGIPRVTSSNYVRGMQAATPVSDQLEDLPGIGVRQGIYERPAPQRETFNLAPSRHEDLELLPLVERAGLEIACA
jgi:hypothetical protein